MVTYNDIEKAHKRISEHIHNTPILTSDSLDNELGSNLFFKCENFQKTGSFKIRGATNSILQLKHTEIKNGIITTSSGNHGAAVAFIADKIGTSSKIIMPNNTPKNLSALDHPDQLMSFFSNLIVNVPKTMTPKKIKK